jgi:hypothetical protein
MSRCLDESTLESFVAGRLAGEALQSAEIHLESCRRCAEALARSQLVEEMVSRIRDLESSRQELADTLATLPSIEERMTTTLQFD